MEYDGYAIGPVLRRLRNDKKLTLEKVSELTGLSTSSIKQIEQGGRNLSMRSLYLFMEAYECDANTLLNIGKKDIANGGNQSIDDKLYGLPERKRKYFMETFLYMLDQAAMLAS